MKGIILMFFLRGPSPCCKLFEFLLYTIYMSTKQAVGLYKLYEEIKSKQTTPKAPASHPWPQLNKVKPDGIKRRS
jgi:hypothetical protein